MFARFSIVLASIVFSVSLTLPVFAERGSGRSIPESDRPTITKQNPDMVGREGVPPSAGSGSRVKPARQATKSEVTYDLYIQTDRGLSFYGTYDRHGASATADRLRLDDETVVCIRSDEAGTLSICPTNF
ncbi:MAG: hypothetical protein KME11_04735 [Timaviella obliquedivisa GSE-PSE-MK23-08B]|jgi:hypothetical protein|nr:hypothetical protein [Timaviella obliquedivisa GSE-PSE-MK23-08B]